MPYNPRVPYLPPGNPMIPGTEIGVTPFGMALAAYPAMEALGNWLHRLTYKDTSDNFKIPFQKYFPNYPGDPLQDLLSNKLINWSNLFQKRPLIKGSIMNAGIDPNFLIANQPQRIGSYGIPRHGGLNFASNYQPPPAVIQNFTAASQFKPGPTSRYQTDPGGTRFGVQDLPNDPGLTPAPSAPTLEGLLKILRGG